MITSSNYHTVQIELQTISLEGNFTSNMISKLNTVFNSLIDIHRETSNKLQSFFESEQANFKVRSIFTSEQKSLSSKVRPEDYLKISLNNNIIVPAGFNSELTLLNHIDFLQKTLETVSKIDHDILLPLAVDLGRFINEKDARMAIFSGTNQYDDLDKKRIVIKNSVSQYYDEAKYGTGGERALHDLIKRSSDLDDVFKAFAALNLHAANLPHQSIKSNLKRIDDLMGMIIEMNHEGELNRVSPEALERIAKSCLIAANWVEFYSMINVMIANLDNTIQSVMKVIKEKMNF